MSADPRARSKGPKDSIAYFSMEIGLESGIPTYSGGLGVLAGDTLRAAADAGLPLVGVTLLHRQGYFRQRLDERGRQREEPVDWEPEAGLAEVEPRIEIELEGRRVQVRAWRYLVGGMNGHRIPVYLLDTMLPGNDPQDRGITNQLYGGDERYRLRQEAVLGLGGMAMLRALGYRDASAYHMNEGHSALLTLALLRERTGGPVPGTITEDGLSGHEVTDGDVRSVRARCVFTTHTPVPAGHDQFPLELVRDVLGEESVDLLRAAGCCIEDRLNMTYLALVFSRFVNGVAVRHGEISQAMFPEHPIAAITNGVHAGTWTTEPFQELFDTRIPDWRGRNSSLRHATIIPDGEIAAAHAEAKRALLAEVKRRTARSLSPEAMTIGFARRATVYKRSDLLFSDLDRLRSLSRGRPIQAIFAGKAHPKDEPGKALVRRVFEAATALGDDLRVVYLEDYDMEIARLLCAGVDLWLNTPHPPQEASGTSGMKAALNGVPSLSVLDGWWIEGHIEGVTGWSIGESHDAAEDPVEAASALYDKLERVILPLFYDDPEGYARVMRSAIALNGSFFNAERMLLQYVERAYRA